MRFQAVDDLVNNYQPIDPIPILIPMLKNPKQHIRMAAAFTLIRIRDKRALGPILELLKDSDPVVRGGIAKSLPFFTDPRIAQPLLALLKDNNETVREAALEALAKTPYPCRAEAMLSAMHDRSEKIRAKAISLIKHQLGAQNYITEITGALKDESSQVKITALWALHLSRDPRTITPTIELLQDKDEAVRKVAISVLHMNSHSEAIEPVIHCLDDESNAVWMEAAKFLRSRNRMDAIKPPRILREGPDADASYLVAESVLFGARDPGFANLLIQMLVDRKSSIRENAAKALGKLKATEAFIPLQNLLQDTEGLVQAEVAGALWKIDPVAAEPIISPLIAKIIDDLSYRDAGVRKVATWNLRRIAHPRAVPALIQSLKDHDPKVRKSAADALGEIGDVQATLPLLKFFNDKTFEKDLSLYFSVEKALIKIKDPRAAEPLISALDNEKTGRGAAEVLIEIGPPAADALCAKLKRGKREVRYALILANMHDPRAIPFLIEALKYSDKDTTESIKNGLVEIGPGAVAPLLTLLGDKDIHLVTHAIQCLGKMRDESAVGPLAEKIGDSAPSIRASAIKALGQIGSPKAIAPLIETLGHRTLGEDAGRALKMINPAPANELMALLKHQDQYVRANTREPTGLNNDIAFANAFATGLKDPEASVRVRAIEGLRNVFREAKLDFIVDDNILFNALKDSEQQVRKTTLEIFSYTPARRKLTYRPLCELMHDDSPSVRELAASDLKVLSDPRSLSCIIDALDKLDGEYDGETKKELLLALGEIGDESAIAPIIEILGVSTASSGNGKLAPDGKNLPTQRAIYLENNRRLVTTAIDVLGDFNDQRAVQALIAMLPEQDFRRNTIEALKKITRKDYSNYQPDHNLQPIKGDLH